MQGLSIVGRAVPRVCLAGGGLGGQIDCLFTYRCTILTIVTSHFICQLESSPIIELCI